MIRMMYFSSWKKFISNQDYQNQPHSEGEVQNFHNQDKFNEFMNSRPELQDA